MLIDYHMHTELTDGTRRPVECARVAVERKLDEIGYSDHAPAGSKNSSALIFLVSGHRWSNPPAAPSIIAARNTPCLGSECWPTSPAASTKTCCGESSTCLRRTASCAT